MLPQAALAAPGSELSRVAPTLVLAEPMESSAVKPSVDLICPADEIFDAAAFADSIGTVAATCTTHAEIRTVAVELLSTANAKGRAIIAKEFADRPFAARPLTSAYTFLTDSLVKSVLHVAQTQLHPLPNPTKSERIAVIAVGGYGRGEMAPFSDVDLLFLTPYKTTAWAESIVESMLYMLWDLKLKVGHAIRTIKDCIRLGREDFTIRTAMLEHRFVVGDRQLADKLDMSLRNELFKDTGHEFIEAKLEERDKRHRKQGGQRYMVEPNVKEGKGGLRDLQSLFWIAKYIH